MQRLVLTLASLLTEAFDQPVVLQRDARMVGQGREQASIINPEAPDLPAAVGDDECPDRAGRAGERRDQEVDGLRGKEDVTVERVGRADHDRSCRGVCGVVDVVRDVARALQLAGGRCGRRRQQAAIPIVEVEPGAFRVHQVARFDEQCRQHSAVELRVTHSTRELVELSQLAVALAECAVGA